MILDLPKRLFVGRPIRSGLLDEQLLPKKLALPVFCSDPLSSVAYATEQIVLVLGLAGLGFYHFTGGIAAAIVVLLILVVLSYRQTCYAYPNGGGAYAVASENLGRNAGLTAAAALLVDYVLTVAVSVVAGVAAITSAVPSLSPHAVGLSLFFVLLLAVVNLRGVKESGKTFAIPTYGFVGSVYLIFAFAAWRMITGHTVVAESARLTIHPTHTAGGLAALFLVLRAFASGCTALTGVEAVSNGVPAFRKPKSRNAAGTLVMMAVLAITMFVGTTVLALVMHVHASEAPCGLTLNGQCATEAKTVIAQIGAAAFGGDHAVLFFIFSAFTAAILILAANTAFNGFPVLGSILARDGFLPRQLHTRGDRLVFSNGILLLAGFAGVLIWAFDADVTRLVQLYIVGVFVSFTLSQAGMVVHWRRELRNATDAGMRRRLHRSQIVNGLGAAVTALVLVIVLLSKFVEGAWIAVLSMVILFALMKAIAHHYYRVAAQLRIETHERPLLPARNHAFVLVSKLHLPAMRALAYAKSTRPSTLAALAVRIDEDDVRRLQEQWAALDLDIPLIVIDSQYRELTRPVIDYIRDYRRTTPRDVVTVFIPEYVVQHWWEQLLHNQSALRLKGRLLFEPGVMVTSVPWQLAASESEQARLLAALRSGFTPEAEAPRA